MEKQKNLSIILIPILIVTVIWVLSNVYHSYVNSTLELPVQEEIIPIDGSFDTKTILQIKERIRVNPLNDIIPVAAENNIDNETGTSAARLNTDSETGTASADTEL